MRNLLTRYVCSSFSYQPVVCVQVLYFRQHFEQKNTKQQIAKSFIFLFALNRIYNILMIKAVLWSRLAMVRHNIRNTHTQVLWEKGFQGETLLVLVTKYGQKRHPEDSCYIILDCSLDCYISMEIAMQLYTQFLPLSAHTTERLICAHANTKEIAILSNLSDQLYTQFDSSSDSTDLSLQLTSASLWA